MQLNFIDVKMVNCECPLPEAVIIVMFRERPEKLARVTTSDESTDGISEYAKLWKWKIAKCIGGGRRGSARGRRRRGSGHSRALAYMQCDDTGARERCTL